MKKTVAIIHFNTPELTEAAILSLRKHGGEDYDVVIFDNSRDTILKDGDKAKARPFVKKMKGVRIINNRKGQVINFDKWLDSIPDKNEQIGISGNYRWASAIHIYTVQKLWDIIKAPFILMESDVLLRQDINQLWLEDYAVVGHKQDRQPGNRAGVPRLLPFLCFMNVPLLVKHGARYYDKERCWGLLPDFNARGNWYDTGATVLEDVMLTKPALRGHHIDLHPVIAHYGGGSWHKNDLKNQKAWLEKHAELWK